jgi:hypothetical protein
VWRGRVSLGGVGGLGAAGLSGEAGEVGGGSVAADGTDPAAIAAYLIAMSGALAGMPIGALLEPGFAFPAPAGP